MTDTVETIHVCVLAALVFLSFVILLSSTIQIWHVLQDCNRRKARRIKMMEKKHV